MGNSWKIATLAKKKGLKLPSLRKLKVHFIEAVKTGGEPYDTFASQSRNRVGGIFIPYIFWVHLKQFTDEGQSRDPLFHDILAFTKSDFEEEETKKMKSLLITYFAQEKEFEIDKIQNLIIDKSHPSVQEYFRKLITFVKKNQTSVNMYIEKFQMLKDRNPDFELLKLPVMKLKERLELA